MYEKSSPLEIKGAVTAKSKEAQHSNAKLLVNIWNEKYVLQPAWWKGPYDISPVLRMVAAGADVLDIGCGTGKYLVALHRNGFRVVGADLSRAALALLDPRYLCVLSDVQQLPFSDQSFDAVTCYGLLGHLAGRARTRGVAELFRVLRDEGLVLVEVLGRRDMRYGKGAKIAAHTFIRGGIPHHHFSPGELCELFQSAGFDVQALDEKISHKHYKGAEHTKHRIVMVAEKR